MQTVKVVGAELAVAFPISQDVKSDLQKFVGNGQDGALGSTPSRQAPVQRREIVVPSWWTRPMPPDTGIVAARHFLSGFSRSSACRRSRNCRDILPPNSPGAQDPQTGSC